MKGKVKRILINVGVPLLSVGALFLIWFLAAIGEGNELILPSPENVLKKFFLLWKEKNFFKSLFSTLDRTFLCFVISFTSGLTLATISHLFKPAKKFLTPFVSVARSAPTVAVILILYAFFPAKKMAVVVGCLIGFPIFYSSFVSALDSVDQKIVTMAKVYRVPVVRRVFGIYFPAILPMLFDASASTLSLTLKVVIAAEILTLVPFSLGGKIQTAYASFEIAYLLAWTLLAVLLSYALEIAVSVLKYFTVRWQK